MQPKNPEEFREYGRGNRARRQINYSDEPGDDQIFNMADLDDENNAMSNDYTPVEVPKVKREEKKKENVDIDQLISNSKPKEEAFFEDEDN